MNLRTALPCVIALLGACSTPEQTSYPSARLENTRKCTPSLVKVAPSGPSIVVI